MACDDKSHRHGLGDARRGLVLFEKTSNANQELGIHVILIKFVAQPTTQGIVISVVYNLGIADVQSCTEAGDVSGAESGFSCVFRDVGNKIAQGLRRRMVPECTRG